MTSLTAEENANVQTINAFFAAWNAKDYVKAMTYVITHPFFCASCQGDKCLNPWGNGTR